MGGCARIVVGSSKIAYGSSENVPSPEADLLGLLALGLELIARVALGVRAGLIARVALRARVRLIARVALRARLIARPH
jgi:hypothetical protein